MRDDDIIPLIGYIVFFFLKKHNNIRTHIKLCLKINSLLLDWKKKRNKNRKDIFIEFQSEIIISSTHV